MKVVKTKIIYFLLTFLAVLLALTAGNVGGAVKAAENTPAQVTDVLTDLVADENFDIKQYPTNPQDFSVYVIQVAESKGGNLYVYTYQPSFESKSLFATAINMSLTREIADTELYTLTFVNTQSVFCKYRVNGVKIDVDGDYTHFYNVTSIYRKWNKDIDKPSDNDNTINSVAFPVKNIYQVTKIKGETTYIREPTYTINIINPYADYLFYNTSHRPQFGAGYINVDKTGFVDSFYVAFSTDWEIEKLMSAKVHYYHRSVSGYVATLGSWIIDNNRTETEFIPETVSLTYTDKYETSGSYWNYGVDYNYNWDRIQTISDFIEGENLNEETLNELDDKQWVLRFAEYERTQRNTDYLVGEKIEVSYSEVERVTILSLEFETDGVCYNLGAINDEISGDNIPGNAHNSSEGNCTGNIFGRISDLFRSIPTWLIVVIYITILIIIIAILALIFPPVWAAIKLIFKGILFVISLPFKGIKKLAELHRKRKEEKQRQVAQNVQTDYKPPARKSTAKNKKRGKKK